ncbi:conserved Plasmodium protein, unknown function [Plasmodium knowlesi strain H]|uniref:PUM-HD domain-containing protein n=3 Tax=Plasmodium knowlesi TaxID=5850 RepID=A0A5K1US23_PLAKH|nr:mRNA-binding protein PUF3, putative [Plasmodium knowlesi strain H]OTN64335.1 Uncharacterized protein PKNOH_S130195400 [Plasmodium knowlesi]CAA9989116.1 mRNA-binding protein PUF3, putative [Plasmodium knowlesi strain H]SBO27332.1 conserved Plasmodium protein, unknown function [Plasmodium knowlesi strain H]SBO28955.1 conserved Plasmodium protein, unknown function [Plasmodium knowlesi strain H]VVS78590.1 mRNA-binding protein PUF3, putative [Plasmodium knowlesi strain H]|eukprot:XP_002261463.1 hypothetical protein, conserved in Plasmodium species [Plasmodium knowlesi strain H]
MKKSFAKRKNKLKKENNAGYSNGGLVLKDRKAKAPRGGGPIGKRTKGVGEHPKGKEHHPRGNSADEGKKTKKRPPKESGGKKIPKMKTQKRRGDEKRREVLNEKCKKIMNDENLSKSKKKKLIKENKKKVIVENYDYYKKLRIKLNDLLQTKDKEEKKRQINLLCAELKKVQLDKFARTNLGYHIISSLVINGSEEIQKKLWKNLYEHMNDISTYNFVSIVFQCFYKHAKGEQIRKDIHQWLLKNPKTFFTKFASRLWNTVFQKQKTDMRTKITNYLIIPNGKSPNEKIANGIKNITLDILKKDTKEIFETFNEENKMLIRKHLIEVVEILVEKELLYNIVSHNILLTVSKILNDEELANVMETIHQGCEYLLSTNLGNQALIYLLGYATNKHKKNLIKVLKNDICDLCKNSVNFLLIIRLLKITDDTKLLNDFVVKKIANNFEDIFNDYYGFYVVMEFFYDLNQSNQDKFLYVQWKELIYSKAPKSVKDADKRKSEIIQPVMDQLQTIFQDINKLAHYVKDKKYLIIICEFLSHSTNEQVVKSVLKNILSLVEQIILACKNKEEDVSSKYSCKNVNDLIFKILGKCGNGSTTLPGILVDEDIPFYRCLSNILFLHLETVIKSELIKTVNNLLRFLKDNDAAEFERALASARQTDNEQIYRDLKDTLPTLTHFDTYLEFVRGSMVPHHENSG